jgi:hypothetical protein
MRALAVLLLVLASCSSTFAYTGPTALDPFISVDTRVVLDSVSNQHFPAWKHTGIASVTNPSNNEMAVDVSCDVTLMLGVVLPPRSVTEFYLNPSDRLCTVSYARY